MIVEEAGEDIPTLFEKYGEARFRELECAAVSSLAALTGRVIATGGGAILREENSRALKMNGRLYFLDRPLSALMPTEDRPTARDREMIEKRYNERYSIYRRVADEVIDADASAEEVAMKIIK